MKKIIFLAVLIFLFGCSKDNKSSEPTSPSLGEDEYLVASKEKTTVEEGDYKIVFPAGTFTEETLVKVSQINAGLEISLEGILQDSIEVSQIGDYDVGTAKDETNYYLSKAKKAEGMSTISFLPKETGLKKSSLTSSILIYFSNHSLNLRQETKLELAKGSYVLFGNFEPVLVLVHGFTSTPETWQKVNPETRRTFLEEMQRRYEGRVYVFQYPTGESIDANAQKFIDLLGTIYQDSPEADIDIIAHSMGGKVVRAAMLKTPLYLRNFVSLGSPFNGAFLDYNYARQLVASIASIDQDPNNLVLYSNLLCEGGYDLLFNSPYNKRINAVGGDLPYTNYFNVVGDINGEGDGLVNISSAQMSHPNFPTTRETPKSLDGTNFNIGHNDLTIGHKEVINKVLEFINKNDSRYNPPRPDEIKNNSPWTGQSNVSKNPLLSWDPADGRTDSKYSVHIGTDYIGELIAEKISETKVDVTGLQPNTVYFWQVTEFKSNGQIIGHRNYHFKTGD